MSDSPTLLPPVTQDDGLTLQPSVNQDSRPIGPRRVITFHHPGYPAADERDVLLQLEGVDTPDGGLCHRTAWLACAIVAGNAWKGYLTEGLEDSPRVTVETDILTRTDYWFHVPAHQPLSTLAPYPVVSSFQDWQFPHQNLPPTWSHPPQAKDPVGTDPPSELFAAGLHPGQPCRISQCSDHTEPAYVCPKSEYRWFWDNDMDIYNSGRCVDDALLMDDQNNTSLLRKDLRAGFDNGKLVVVPKGYPSTWVLHFLEHTHELKQLYHNTAAYDISNVAIEFLLARFAWSIFPFLRTFRRAGVKRYLARFENEETKEFRWDTRWMAPKESEGRTLVPPASYDNKNRHRDVWDHDMGESVEELGGVEGSEEDEWSEEDEEDETGWGDESEVEEEPEDMDTS